MEGQEMFGIYRNRHQSLFLGLFSALFGTFWQLLSLLRTWLVDSEVDSKDNRDVCISSAGSTLICTSENYTVKS